MEDRVQSVTNKLNALLERAKGWTNEPGYGSFGPTSCPIPELTVSEYRGLFVAYYHRLPPRFVGDCDVVAMLDYWLSCARAVLRGPLASRHAACVDEPRALSTLRCAIRRHEAYCRDENNLRTILRWIVDCLESSYSRFDLR